VEAALTPTIVDGTTLYFRCDAAVFESVASWVKIRSAKAGSSVVAAGAPKECQGFKMVPIRPTGAVDVNEVSTEDVTAAATGLAALRAAATFAATQAELPTDGLCWDWKRGHCAKGMKCRWSHLIVPSLEPEANRPTSQLIWEGTRAKRNPAAVSPTGIGGIPGVAIAPPAKLARVEPEVPTWTPQGAVINDGTVLVSRAKLQVFSSASSCVEIGAVGAGEVVVAAGAPQGAVGCFMVPIRPKGFVRLNGIFVRKGDSGGRKVDASGGDSVDNGGAAWECKTCGETNKAARRQCNSCAAERDGVAKSAIVDVAARCGSDGKRLAGCAGWDGANAEVLHPTKLRKGTMVKVHGLVGKPELNGRIVECDAFDAASGRWHVSTCDDERFSLKEANLLPTSSWQSSFKL